MRYTIPPKSDLIDGQYVKVVGPDGMIFGFQYDEQTNSLYCKTEEIVIPSSHGTTHISTDPVPNATTSTNGLMSKDDKAKLDALMQMRVGVLGYTGNGIATDGGWIEGDLILAAGSEFISLERIGNIVRFNVGTQIPACTTEECANIYWIQDETEINAIRPPSCNGKLPDINGYGELKIYTFPESAIYNKSASTSILTQKGNYPCLIFKRYDDALTPNASEFEMVLERHDSGLMKTGMYFTPGITNATSSGTQGKVTLIYKTGVDEEGNQLSFTFDPELEEGILGKIFYNNFSITTQWGIIDSYPDTLTSHNQYYIKKWDIENEKSVGDKFIATNIWNYTNVGQSDQSLKLDITKDILPIGEIVQYWEYTIYDGGTEDIKRYFINKEPSINAGSLWSLANIIRFGDTIDRAELDDMYNPSDPTAQSLSIESISDMKLYEGKNWGLNGLEQPLYLFENQQNQINELLERHHIDLTAIEGDIKHIYVYDTTNDDTNWRNDKNIEETTWYRENKDSINRGGTDNFPQKAILVCADKFYIFDASDGALWMRFDSNVDNKSWNQFVASAARNGHIYIIEKDGNHPKQTNFTGIIKIDNSHDNKYDISTTNNPAARTGFAYTIYNDKLYIWGGVGGSGSTYYNNGYILDLIKNTWSTMASSPLTARESCGYIKFESKLFIWGGKDGSNIYNDGAIYDLDADSWTNISTCPLVGRCFPSIHYYNGKIYIWGGIDSIASPWVTYNDGAIYDIATDSWSSITTTDAPTARCVDNSVLVDDKIYIFGGWYFDSGVKIRDDGAIYNITEDKWYDLSLPTAKLALSSTIALDDNRIFIWGGMTDSSTYIKSGYIYDIITNTYNQITSSSLNARYGATIGLNNERYVIIFGGTDNTNSFNDGEIYDLTTNTWIKSFSDSSKRLGSTGVVWRNNFVIWGGYDLGGTYLDTGIIYSLGFSDVSESSMRPRYYHAHCKVGSHKLFIHGGYNDYNGYLNDCWIFDEETYEWTEIIGCPLSERAFHTAVYDGSQYIYVWGGYNEEIGFLEDGAIYDVTGDSWSSMDTEDCPEARALHTAVWADSTMIIWGGITYRSTDGELDYLYTGGKYDPSGSPKWSHIKVNKPGGSGANDSPAGRIKHTAIVYDDKMYILGGYSYTVPNRSDDLRIYADLREYDPSLDLWTGKTGITHPIHSHTAIVIGDYMYVDGGVENDGSNIAPCTTHHVYSFTGNNWTNKTAQTDNHTEHSATAYSTDGYFEFGGIKDNDDDVTFLDDLVYYDISGNSWSTLNTYNNDEIAMCSMYMLTDHIVVMGGYNKSNVGGVRWIDLIADTDKMFKDDGLYSFKLNRVSQRNDDSDKILVDDNIKLQSNDNYDIRTDKPLEMTKDTSVGDDRVLFDDQVTIVGFVGGTIIYDNHRYDRILIGGTNTNNDAILWSSIFHDCNRITANKVIGYSASSTNYHYRDYISYSHGFPNIHESIGTFLLTSVKSSTTAYSLATSAGIRLCKITTTTYSDEDLTYIPEYYDANVSSLYAFSNNDIDDSVLIATDKGIYIIKHQLVDTGGGSAFNNIHSFQKYDSQYVTDLIIGQPIYNWLVTYEEDSYDFTRNVIPSSNDVSSSMEIAFDFNLYISDTSKVYQSQELNKGYTTVFNGGHLRFTDLSKSRGIPDGSDSMMISGWWKFDNITSIQYLISQWDGSNNKYRLYLDVDQKIHVDFGATTSLVSLNKVEEGKWYKIDIIWYKIASASYDALLYINGSLQDYDGSAADITSVTNNKLVIGASYNGSSYNDYFYGNATHISVSILHDGLTDEFARIITSQTNNIPINSPLDDMIKLSYEKGNKAIISNPSNVDNNRLYGLTNRFSSAIIDDDKLYYSASDVVGNLSITDDTKKELLYQNESEEYGFNLSNSEHIAYWKCNEGGGSTLTDSINNYNGTCNDVDWVTVHNKIVLALEPAAKGYVVLPTLTLSDDDLLINLWFHTLMTDTTAINNGEILYLSQSGAGTPYIKLDLTYTSGTSIQLSGVVSDGSSTATVSTNICEYNSTYEEHQLHLNWIMISLRIESGSTLSLYVNDQLKDSTALSFNIPTGDYDTNFLGVDAAPSGSSKTMPCLLSDILITEDISTDLSNIYEVQRPWFYRSDNTEYDNYITSTDDTIVYQADTIKKLIIQEKTEEIDYHPSITDVSAFYRGTIDTTLPGMKVEEYSLTGIPKHPITIWDRHNHDDAYMKVMLGRPTESKYPPIDILLRAPIDSYDTKYFEVYERGIINEGTLSSDHYVLCRNISYDDLGNSGYIYILTGDYQGYIWKYDYKLYYYNNVVALVGKSQFPYKDDITGGTNPIQYNEISKFEPPIIVASMQDNYTTPVLRLEFSVIDQTGNQSVQLQFKAGILDMIYPYELNETDTVTDNLIRGLRPKAYTVSKIYSQTGFISDPSDSSNIVVSDPNFIVYDGGYYNTSDEQWNTLELIYRFPQLWVWWNNLLITPLGDPTSIDSNANPCDTSYFPMQIDFPVGKYGLRLWPGAKIRQIEIRDKLKSINEYARQ